jgi:hypothetical protein
MSLHFRMSSALRLLLVALIVTVTGLPNAHAGPKSLSTVSGLRAEVARQFARTNGIRNVTLDSSDPAVIQVEIDNERVRAIAVDVTNLFERLKAIPASQKPAEVQKFVKTVSTHLLANF